MSSLPIIDLKRVGSHSPHKVGTPEDCIICHNAAWGDILVNNICGRCLYNKYEESLPKLKPDLFIQKNSKILFEDKFATLWLEKEAGNREWWWVEEESKTVFVVSYCPANWPGLVVHRIQMQEVEEELVKLLSEGWEVTRGEGLPFLPLGHEPPPESQAKTLEKDNRSFGEAQLGHEFD